MQVQGKYDARAFLAEQMTRAQSLRLKRLSEEAYQPAQYNRTLSSVEAARRIQVLEAEIELANSF
jgi:predicted Zn-dependent protease